MSVVQTIKIGSQTIDYKETEVSDGYVTHGKLRWAITDEYGWPIKKDEFRDMKLEVILNGVDNKSNYIYNLSLQRPGEKGWGHYSVYLYFKEKRLKLSGEELNINLKCTDFEEAENLVNLLIEGNGLVLMPISKSEFKMK